MAGFNTQLGTRKDSAEGQGQPIEKADAGDKRDLFREEKRLGLWRSESF